MTDHADTIRRNAQEIIDKPQMPNGGSEDGAEAWYWTHDHLASFARDVLALLAERARCEQAIDALREIAHMAYQDAKATQCARAALLSLGEQP